MATLSVPLTDAAKRFLEAEATRRGLPDSGAVLGELIADAMTRAEREAELERLLDEGLNSGPPIEADNAYLERKREQLVERSNASRGSRG